MIQISMTPFISLSFIVELGIFVVEIMIDYCFVLITILSFFIKNPGSLTIFAKRS